MKTILRKIFGIRAALYVPILVLLAYGYICAAIYPNVEVKYVYKVLPSFFIYVDDIPYEDINGLAIAMLVFVEKEYKDNDIVITHELIHVKQGYRTLFLNNLLIPFDDTLLVKMECEAYATEVDSLNEAKYLSIFLKEEYETSLSRRRIQGYLVYYWQMQKR